MRLNKCGCNLIKATPPWSDQSNFKTQMRVSTIESVQLDKVRLLKGFLINFNHLLK